MTSTLTADQHAAAEMFFDFLMSDKSTFVLSGGAGVGKTFLMGHISNQIMQTYQDSCKLLGLRAEYDTLAFTATTNKAAEVLEQTLGKPVQTIHSYLGLKVKENWKTGKVTLEKTSNYKIRNGVVLFIDESSMIDMDLYKTVLESFTNSKIVFVGDHAQMAPVGESVSQVYAHIDPDTFVFLGKPVRNAGSPALMDLCAQLRHTVETGEFSTITATAGSVEYLDDATMQVELIKQFANNMDPSARILCYTNNRVEQFNEYIREIRNLPSGFGPGDITVVAQTHAIGKFTFNVEREVEIVYVDPALHDAGYEKFFADGVPVQYHHAVVKTPGSSSEGTSVYLPANKERWRMAIKQLAAKKSWGEYFELKGLCLDLRDKAACTVYKSQGSTYDTVFIDIGNIGTSYDAEQVARMLFVGVSRATTKVFFFGRLPPRYNGAIAA